MLFKHFKLKRASLKIKDGILEKLVMWCVWQSILLYKQIKSQSTCSLLTKDLLQTSLFCV